MRKRQLSTFIRIMIAILLLLAASILGMGRMVMRAYNDSEKTRVRNMVENLDSTNGKIQQIMNMELLAIVMDDSNAKKLASMNRKAQEDSIAASSEIEAMMGLQEKLQTFASVYGTKYYFWIYEENSGSYISYGQGDYSEREQFKESTLSKIRDGFKQLTINGHWFIEDGKYVGTTYKFKSFYIGAWMDAGDYLRSYLGLKFVSHFEVELLDYTGEFVTGSGIKEGRIYSLEQARDKKPLGTTEIRQKSSGNDFSILVHVYRELQESSMLLQLCLTIAALAIVVLILLFLLELQRKVLRPIMSFYNQLCQHSDSPIRMEEPGILELNEAAMRVNALTTKVRDLQIENYQQTIRRQEVELGFAQQQIKPHFFINCLNVIYGMAQARRFDKIQDLCLNVSDYMRLLFASRGDYVPITKEFNLIDKYLSAMKDVYGQDFSYTVENEAGDIRVPPLMIQTFVENSIKHSGLDAEDHLDVSVKCHIEKSDDGKTVVIEVQDTGLGFEEGVLKELNEKIARQQVPGHQIGIMNVLARLNLLYKDRYQICFANNETGAYVNVRIPAEMTEQEK